MMHRTLLPFSTQLPVSADWPGHAGKYGSTEFNQTNGDVLDSRPVRSVLMVPLTSTRRRLCHADEGFKIGSTPPPRMPDGLRFFIYKKKVCSLFKNSQIIKKNTKNAYMKKKTKKSFKILKKMAKIIKITIIKSFEIISFGNIMINKRNYT